MDNQFKNKRNNGSEFYLTRGGHEYLNKTLPTLIKSINELTIAINEKSDGLNINNDKLVNFVNNISLNNMNSQFYLTVAGNHYFNRQLPMLIKEIQNLAKEISKNNELIEKKNTSK